MMEKQQTAVEWLESELYSRGPIGEDAPVWLKELFQKAKQMHREQIIDAVGVGSQFDRDYLYGYHDKAEQYYTQTYGE
jgi:hypothetical protein